ncbi:MAG: alpha/beta hydrolase [Clostridia bacterium]|nr:alpha/beta hydrolase [Clostridia bacterium]
MKPYRIGIVFAHGIQSSPVQFEHLIERLPDGVRVRNLLLPGHGKTTAEFRKVRAEQWLDAVEKECAEMSELCERVIFVGHSMGCLLGLFANKKLGCLSGMLLLCCPFHVHFTHRSVKYAVLASLEDYRTDDPFITADRELNGVSAKHPFLYLFCSRPYLELLKLIRRARKQSFALPSETLFCFSELDEIVGRKSRLHAQNKLGAKTRLLSGCSHSYLTPQAKAEIGDALLDMAARLGEQD